MKHSIKISIALAAYAMLCNYEYASGSMTDGAFPLVAAFNIIAISFTIYSLFNKQK